MGVQAPGVLGLLPPSASTVHRLLGPAKGLGAAAKAAALKVTDPWAGDLRRTGQSLQERQEVEPKAGTPAPLGHAEALGQGA